MPARGCTVLVAAACVGLAPCAAPAWNLVDANIGTTALAAGEPIVLRLDRLPVDEEGRLAITVDDTDVTALSSRTGADQVTLSLRDLQLPGGPHRLQLFVVVGDTWNAVTQLNFENAAGVTGQASAWRPRIDLNLLAQPRSATHGNAQADPRDTFVDATTRGNLALDAALDNGTKLSGAANVSGSSHRNDAVRFAQLHERANKVDLTDYRVDATHGRGSLSVGHVSIGRHALLLNQFQSRGLAGTFRLNDTLDLSLGAVNGNSVVGFDDFTGLYKQEHRIFGGTVGYEADPQQPGRMRVELSLADAVLLPREGFNQGMVAETQRTRGLGLHVSGTFFDQRLRLAATRARSRHDGPDDPQLAGGYALTESLAETRAAHALEASFDVIRAAAWLGERFPFSLTLQARQERVDPLYQAVGLSLAADQVARQLGFNAKAGPLDIQTGLREHTDNADDLPALPKSRTRETQFSVNVPLASLFDVREARVARWWPQMALSLQRAHHAPLRGPLQPPQDGQSVALPQQVLTQRQTALGWRGDDWTLNYAIASSRQDNRTAGSEADDTAGIDRKADLQFAWSPTLRFNAGLSQSRNRSDRRAIESLNRGCTLGLDWRVGELWSLSGQYALARLGDSLNLQSQRSHQASTQLARRFTWQGLGGQPLDGQWFLRHALQESRLQDHSFNTQAAGLNWSLTVGVGVSYQ